MKKEKIIKVSEIVATASESITEIESSKPEDESSFVEDNCIGKIVLDTDD